MAHEFSQTSRVDHHAIARGRCASDSCTAPGRHRRVSIPRQQQRNNRPWKDSYVACVSNSPIFDSETRPWKPVGSLSCISAGSALLRALALGLVLLFLRRGKRVSSGNPVPTAYVRLEEQGFEPWAFRMQSGRSATELHPLAVI